MFKFRKNNAKEKHPVLDRLSNKYKLLELSETLDWSRSFLKRNQDVMADFDITSHQRFLLKHTDLLKVECKATKFSAQFNAQLASLVSTGQLPDGNDLGDEDEETLAGSFDQLHRNRSLPPRRISHTSSPVLDLQKIKRSPRRRPRAPTFPTSGRLNFLSIPNFSNLRAPLHSTKSLSPSNEEYIYDPPCHLHREDGIGRTALLRRSVSELTFSNNNMSTHNALFKIRESADGYDWSVKCPKLYLLNDLLLICKERDGLNYAILPPVYLTSLVVKKSANERQLILKYGEFKLTLKFYDKRIRNEWMEHTIGAMEWVEVNRQYSVLSAPISNSIRLFDKEFPITKTNDPVDLAPCIDSNYKPTLSLSNISRLDIDPLGKIMRSDEVQPTPLPPTQPKEVAEEGKWCYQDKDGSTISIFTTTPDDNVDYILAGTKDFLFFYLTSLTQNKYHYLETYLLSYNTMCEPVELLNMLIDRFHCLPKSFNEIDVDYFLKNKAFVQGRVLMIIITWLTKFWFEFKAMPLLLGTLEKFIPKLKIYGYLESAKTLLHSIEKQEDQSWEANCTLNFNTLEFEVSTILFNEYSCTDIAEQMTLYNWQIFKFMSSKELLYYIWKKDDLVISTNFRKLIDRFNLESRWVVTELCRKETPPLVQAKVITKFISIAKACLKMDNFFSFFSILGGLNMPAVKQLKLSWEQVPPKTLAILEDFHQNLYSPLGNRKLYRRAIEEIIYSEPKKPAIPFLPLILKDLLYIIQGNEDVFSENNMYNYDKFRMIYKTLARVRALQEADYDIKTNQEVYDYINKCAVIDNIDDIYHPS